MFTINGLFETFFTIGIVLAIGYMYYKTKNWGITKSQMDRLFVIVAVSGIMTYLGSSFFDSLFKVIEGRTWEDGGITFLGGAITGVCTFTIMFWLFLKDLRPQLINYLNVVVTGLVLGHAFGRIGCFCAGCCYGRITNSFIGLTFPDGSEPYQYLLRYFLNQGIVFDEARLLALTSKVIPTQLIECLFLFILFTVFILIKKGQLKIYLISYGVFRFIIEFYRADDRGKLFTGLSPSQWLSVLIIIIGITLFIVDLIKIYKPKKVSI